MSKNFDPSKLANRALIANAYGSLKTVNLDRSTHALLDLGGYAHHEIHDAQHYVQVASALLGSGGTLDVMFKTPLLGATVFPDIPGSPVAGHTGATVAGTLERVHPKDATTRGVRQAHMTITIESALASTLRFYRGTTKTFIPGNALIPWNRNFPAFAASPDYYRSAMSIGISSAGTETGTDLLGPIYIGSTSVSGQVKVGGSAGGRGEFILAPGQWYRMELVSRVASNSGTMWFDWYDHAEKTPLAVTS